MLELDRILELLAMDTAWHRIEELAEKTELQLKEIKEIVQFLAAHQLILLNEQGRRAKIEESTNTFLIRIREEEKLLSR